jgi:putative ABC transport system permease protein
MASQPIRALRWLIAGDWRQQPGRIAIAVIAIAVGVALGFAVHLINGSALAAFGQAVRTVSGDADLRVKAASKIGFDERLYPRVMESAGIADASPVIELDAKTTGGIRLALLGLDIIRAAGVTPSLIGMPAKGPGSGEDLFATDQIFLSSAALKATKRTVGQVVQISANGRTHSFVIKGQLPGISGDRRVGMIDIATAQWRFNRIGTIDRIDLKLTPDSQADAVRKQLAAILPAIAVVTDDADEAQQGDALSRAYRVNLDMLALVALFTGSFLVYSTQSLSVARRLQSFALLRTIGLQRSGVFTLVAVEGALTGLIGSVLGLGLGYALASLALSVLGGDLGSGLFGDAPPRLIVDQVAGAVFFALGMAAAIGGSLFPAWQGARAAPAASLKNAGDMVDPRSAIIRWPSVLLLGAGVGAAFLPALGRLPLFGYLSVGLLLAAGIAAMPWLARSLLSPLVARARRSVAIDLAIQHLHGAPGAAATALCGIVASTALMIAMATMVTSFRGAVDEWLGAILVGDLYVRSEPGAGGFDAATQRRIAAIKGIKSLAFNRQTSLILTPGEPPMTLIARPVVDQDETLVLIGEAGARPQNRIAVWLSEPAARLLGRKAGDLIRLPLGEGERFFVAGIWRDYSRQQGAIVIDNRDYSRLTGDQTRDDALIHLRPGTDKAVIERAIRAAALPELGPQLAFAEPGTLRRFALSIFDRSFAITYVLEVIAIIVGLAGVAATASAQATARTREFGMLRHIGVSRAQIISMLGVEGALLGAVGGVVGVTLGIAISQVLIHVINPQSFNWTMTTRLPLPLMASVILALIVASALTAMLAGRSAASGDAVRAVRADW